jgi:hypothetical protein
VRFFKMGNFGLRRQTERAADLEKGCTLIHHAKALSSLRFASAAQMCRLCHAVFPAARCFENTPWCITPVG